MWRAVEREGTPWSIPEPPASCFRGWVVPIRSAEKSTARQASQLVTASRNHTTCPTDKEHLSHTSRNKQFDKQVEWGDVMFPLYCGVWVSSDGKLQQKTAAKVEETYISATMSSTNPVRKTKGSNLRFLGNKMDLYPLAHVIYTEHKSRADSGSESAYWIQAWILQLLSNLVIIYLLAYEDGTDRVFRNVGI